MRKACQKQRWAETSYQPVSQVVSAKEKCLKEFKVHSSEQTSEKEVKWTLLFGESCSSLDRRSIQPQHSLITKPNLEQGPNSLQFCEGKRGEEASEEK